jgi:hypothetical protein
MIGAMKEFRSQCAGLQGAKMSGYFDGDSRLTLPKSVEESGWKKG